MSRTEAMPLQRKIYRRLEVAKLLGVHPTSVDRMIREGRLPKPCKLGYRFTYWPCEVIDNLLSGQQNLSGGDNAI